MDPSNTAGNLPIQLQRSKQIDAICDRFELAWDADSPPRIEEYLGLLPADDRRSLLGELLASELALRGRQDEVCDRAEYSERFPQFLDVVAEVFNRRPPESTKESADAGERYFEIIRAFRAGRQTDAAATAIQGGDRNLRALTSQCSRYALLDPVEADAPPEQQLWLWILETCRRLKSLDPAGVDGVVQQLLASFPPARQSILLDVLLGRTSSQAARASGVTQRTVLSTILIATKLLEQAG